MSYASSFKDLETYKLAREISSEVFLISQSFPREEKYALTDQIRRSSRSVGTQIAESWEKRKYIRHFVSKLTDSDSEQFETQHWLEIALECQYIPKEQFDELTQKCELLGKMINHMIQKANEFCKSGDR